MEKRRRLVWSRAAESDLLSIWIYVAGDASDETADAQLKRIDTFGKSLVHHPFRGRARSELKGGLRSVVADRYVIFYRVTDHAVEIARVLHGRRDLAAIFKTD